MEAGHATSFKLAFGSTTSAYSLVWVQTSHGWFRKKVIESTGVPMLSIKGLRALTADDHSLGGTTMRHVAQGGGLGAGCIHGSTLAGRSVAPLFRVR